MRAVRKMAEGPGNVECVNIKEPTTGKDEVKIRVSLAGICGSDMKFYHWTMREGMRINPPITLGHEFSGVVVEVGKNVTRFERGDRVVSETANYICGHCEHCITGNYLLCNTKRSIGYQDNGAFAEYICVREGLVHKIPKGVTMEEAALCEPASVAARGVFDIGHILPGDVVAVSGPGTIGLITAQIVRNCGAKVILTGLSSDKERLNIAKELGIDMVVEIDRTDVKEIIEEKTRGRGVDTFFECSGSEKALDLAFETVKKQGTVVELAIFKNGARTLLNLNKLVNNEIRVLGSYGQRNWNWTKVLELLESKKLNTAALITHIFSFEECQKAFGTVERAEGIKVILRP